MANPVLPTKPRSVQLNSFHTVHLKERKNKAENAQQKAKIKKYTHLELKK